MNALDSDVAAPRARAVTALLVACALWGFGFLLVKSCATSALGAAPGIDSWFVASFMVTVRFAAAAILLGAALRTVPSRAEWIQGLGLGASAGAGMLLQTDALAYTNASTAAFLTQGYVVFLPVAGALATGSLPPFRVTGPAALVLAGLAILSHFDVHSLRIGRGEAQTLAAAACFTVQILVLDARGFAKNRAGPVSLVMFLTMAVVAAPVAVLTARGASDVGAVLEAPGAFGLLVTITLLPTLGSFVLMNAFQRRVTASEAGVMYATEPVFASAFALFLPAVMSRLLQIEYPNEGLDSRLFVGGALVVVANLLLALRPAEPARPGPTAENHTRKN